MVEADMQKVVLLRPGTVHSKAIPLLSVVEAARSYEFVFRKSK